MEETRRDQDSTVGYTKSVSYSDPLLGQSGAVQSWQDGRRMDASGSLSQCKSNLNTQVKCTELQPGPEGRSNRSRGKSDYYGWKGFSSGRVCTGKLGVWSRQSNLTKCQGHRGNGSWWGLTGKPETTQDKTSTKSTMRPYEEITNQTEKVLTSY